MEAISKAPATAFISSSLRHSSMPTSCAAAARLHPSSSACSSSFGAFVWRNGAPTAVRAISGRMERKLCMASRSESNALVEPKSAESADSFFRSIISNMEKVYLSRNPTAKAVLDLIFSHDRSPVCYDHFAFRTFGVDGYGIYSMAKFFKDFGYVPRDELRFPEKKLKAIWFAPPRDASVSGNESGTNGPLPRIFISELLVDQLSSQSREVIRKYINASGSGYKHAALDSTIGCLTWEKPLYSDYQLLSRESEYAAWTLVNGYALNHLTISTHQLKSQIRNIKTLNQFIENNEAMSPDGLLLQSSTVADSNLFQFADGISECVPCSYIEFAERLLLPKFANMLEEEIKECHRRDGFEVGNADKILESTSKEQLTRKVA